MPENSIFSISNLHFFFIFSQYKRKDVSQFLNENTSEVTDGFSWRGGSAPDTSGIWIWSEIFTHDSPNGDKIAIILMDTQGSFDNESSVRDCSTIFALTAMLSSVLCYNVMRNIREDDLQYLHLFTEYGKLSLKKTNKKPFQELLFIVRDWPFAYEHDFGWVGGQEVVNKRLEKTSKQSEDMKQLRDQLRSSFTNIRGFLMPYPGDSVASGQNYNGNLSDIATKFKEVLKELIPKILSPNNLTIKVVNGQKVRAKHLIHYLNSYMLLFTRNNIPEPKSIFEVSYTILMKM